MACLYNWTTNVTYSDLLREALLGESRSRPGFPQYNITRNMDSTHWTITMGLAGYAPEDITVTTEDNVLHIRGKMKKDSEEKVYVHTGLTAKAFERSFSLGEYVEVEQVTYLNGMLTVELALNLPEAKKPKTYNISVK